MKKLIVLITGVWIGCTSDSKNIENFIPGQYARHYVDEYTNSYDTLSIAPVAESGSEGYSVIQHRCFQKKLDGRDVPQQYRVKRWVGRFDKASKTLVLLPSGNQIFFDPEQKELRMGILPYKKIK